VELTNPIDLVSEIINKYYLCQVMSEITSS